MNTINKPSINDVAKLAGVSTATVSHVVNDTRFVSAKTKLKVLEAIDSLGYFPSAVARGLASNKSKIVGIVFSDISNPFFTSVYKGIESFLVEQGYELTLANTSEVDATQEIVLNTMFSRQIDGLIIAPTGQGSPMLERIISSDIAVVMIDRGMPSHDVSIVRLDNERASFEATAHLIEDGHSKIGLILGLSAVDTTKARLRGYKKALDVYNIPLNQAYIIGGQSRKKGGYQSTCSLMNLPDPPTAIFSTNNLMTLGTLHAFRDLGLQVPTDVGLIGFDDHDWADIFIPPLTVVSQPTFEMGVEAAKMLTQMMKGDKEDDLLELKVLKGKLITRGSCSEHCAERFMKNLKIKADLEEVRLEN